MAQREKKSGKETTEKGLVISGGTFFAASLSSNGKLECCGSRLDPDSDPEWKIIGI